MQIVQVIWVGLGDVESGGISTIGKMELKNRIFIDIFNLKGVYRARRV